MGVTNNGFDSLTGNTLIYGGTLVVSNLDSTHPFAAGNSYKLFNATFYGGTFANIVPASPGPGLAWSTNNLAINGTISISNALASPQITTLFLTGSSLVIKGTNNSPSGPWHLLGSSDVSLPLASWAVVTNGAFDANGTCSITNPLGPVALQFYILRVP
jgi:hypothetical protein